MPTTTLPSGDNLPQIGFGTFDLHDDVLRESLNTALDVGYSHVDTAEVYDNESTIGEVISEWDREEVFLTSKVLPKNLHYEAVIKACLESLERLGTEYLDLFLIHWPNPAISLRETLQAMKSLYDRGRVQNVGVSNFSIYQLRVAQRITDVPIAVNQIEFHPWQKPLDLVEYCQSNGITVSAATPLGRTKVFNDPEIRSIADEYGQPPAQVTLRWEMEKGVVPLPRSSSPRNIEQNLDVFNWELDPEDVARIDAIDHEMKLYEQVWDDPVVGIPP